MRVFAGDVKASLLVEMSQSSKHIAFLTSQRFSEKKLVMSFTPT